MGPALRRGRNKIRIEFVPANAKAAYDAQLRWASVTDQVTRTENGPGRVSATNQSNEGADNRKAVGKVVLEREFAADFAADLPWHHYPPVTALTDADKLDFVVTGNPEVVVRGKTGNLYPIDPKAIGRIKGEELQMGLAIVLGVLYPPQLVAVRDAAGKWAVVY
jgi:hypothetical protein